MGGGGGEYNMTSNDLQYSTQKIKESETRTPLINWDELVCYGRVSFLENVNKYIFAIIWCSFEAE